MGSGLLFCRFSFLTDDVHQVIITHVVNDLLKFFVRSGTACGGAAAAADVGDVRSGQFGDPPLEPVCACCGYVSTLIWVTGVAFGEPLEMGHRLPSLPRRGGGGRLLAADGVVLSN